MSSLFHSRASYGSNLRDLLERKKRSLLRVSRQTIDPGFFLWPRKIPRPITKDPPLGPPVLVLGPDAPVRRRWEGGEWRASRRIDPNTLIDDGSGSGSQTRERIHLSPPGW